MPSAGYPNFAGKHAGEAIFSPADFVAYLRRVGALDPDPAPAGVVLCYQRSLYRHVLQLEGLKPPERHGALHGILPLPSTGGRVGLLGQFGIGAPAAAAALEELAAIGSSAFVSIGTAGSLQRDLEIGDLVLCEAAIRDEGVSHHYLPTAKLATATTAMSAALAAAMRKAGVSFRTGTSWTIDTPYRETVAEARHHQAEGVLCVEMEAAALFAVAQVRGLSVASAFAISDSLAELVWNPQFHGPGVEAGLITLYEAALSALQPDQTGPRPAVPGAPAPHAPAPHTRASRASCAHAWRASSCGSQRGWRIWSGRPAGIRRRLRGPRRRIARIRRKAGPVAAGAGETAAGKAAGRSRGDDEPRG